MIDFTFEDVTLGWLTDVILWARENVKERDFVYDLYNNTVTFSFALENDATHFKLVWM